MVFSGFTWQTCVQVLRPNGHRAPGSSQWLVILTQHGAVPEDSGLAVTLRNPVMALQDSVRIHPQLPDSRVNKEQRSLLCGCAQCTFTFSESGTRSTSVRACTGAAVDGDTHPAYARTYDPLRPFDSNTLGNYILPLTFPHHV